MMGMQPVIISGLVQGLGMGLIFIPLNTMAFATIQPQYRTDGSSLLNLFRSIGASVGLSVVTTLLGANIQTSHEDLAAHVTNSSIGLLDPSPPDHFGIAGVAEIAQVKAENNRQGVLVARTECTRRIYWGDRGG